MNASWERARLRHLTRLNPEVPDATRAAGESRVPFFSMNALGDFGEVNRSNSRPIAELLGGYSYFRDGDVAFAKVTPCFENGKGWRVEGVGDLGAFATTELTVLRPTPRLDGQFLSYLLQADVFRCGAIASMTGAGGLKRVADGYVRDFEFRRPPLDEQRRIAAYLERETAEIDAFMADQERLIELLIERRTSAWQASVESLALTRGVVELRRVIASIVDGPFGSALTSARYTDAGTRVVRLGNIGVNEFLNSDEAYIDDDYASELTSHAVSPGDVVVAGLGDKGHPLGRSAVVPDGMGAAIVKADCYRVRPTSAVTAAYLAWALSSEYCAQQFRVLSRGSTRQRLNTAVVRDVRLPVPALCDQEQVVAEHEERESDLLAAIADAREAIALSKERRAALISAAVTGKIDVTS